MNILSISYGKDSLACLGACEQLGWRIDKIVHAEVWATNDIPADLPPMVEFKKKADEIIKTRWGKEVEHLKANKTYQDIFYRMNKKKNQIYGFPMIQGQWCNSELKMPPLKGTSDSIYFVGIAADEPNRFHNLNTRKRSPLVETGWTEADCKQWCIDNELLSPIYTDTCLRGGCWFCHNQGVGQLRELRHNYPDLWALLLKWDTDSPVTFHADGRTVHDFDRRFQAEDEKFIDADNRFYWKDLDMQQYNIFHYMDDQGNLDPKKPEKGGKK